jgi:hypothetical protein
MRGAGARARRRRRAEGLRKALRQCGRDWAAIGLALFQVAALPASARAVSTPPDGSPTSIVSLANCGFAAYLFRLGLIGLQVWKL